MYIILIILLCKESKDLNCLYSLISFFADTNSSYFWAFLATHVVAAICMSENEG